MRLDLPDLTDLELFVDGFPHDVFTRLRREAPVWWQAPTEHTPDGLGFWVISRHRDVFAVAADAATFSSERGPDQDGGGTLIQDLPYGFAPGVLLNMMDDPRHHRIRKLVTPSVAPRALARLEPELRARTASILDAAAEKGTCDFLVDVAAELPLQATAQLLGVPQRDRHDLFAWSNATLTYEGRELGETSEVAQQAAASMAAYGRDLLRTKRDTPEDDLLSVVVNAEVDGEPLSDLELEMFFNLLIAAGSETTRNSIALGLAALIENRDQLVALRADRSLMPTAVEEILRWSSATTYNRRTATRAAEIGGQAVGAGEKVTLWWASANRDEEIFDEPFRFDVRRSPNPHLAFGHGTHFCLGAALARIEVRVLFEELLDRFADFELAGPIEYTRTNKHAGVRRMPVTFRAAAPPSR